MRNDSQPKVGVPIAVGLVVALVGFVSMLLALLAAGLLVIASAMAVRGCAMVRAQPSSTWSSATLSVVAVIGVAALIAVGARLL